MFLPATTKNFDALADEVVSAHFLDNSSLQDNLVKVASRESLNPNEVQRLVERTNTFASLRLLKTAMDKEAGLELVDYDTALGKTHPKDKESLTKEASVAPTLHIPNMRKTPGLEKVAFAKMETKEVPIKVNHIKNIFTLKKEAGDIRMRKVAAELKASEGMDALLADFTRTQGPEFQKFANEALTLHGPCASPILESLASTLREPSEFTKVANLVDDHTTPHKVFSTVLESLHSIVKLAQDLDTTEAKLAAAWSSAKA